MEEKFDCFTKLKHNKILEFVTLATDGLRYIHMKFVLKNVCKNKWKGEKYYIPKFIWRKGSEMSKSDSLWLKTSHFHVFFMTFCNIGKEIKH